MNTPLKRSKLLIAVSVLVSILIIGSVFSASVVLSEGPEEDIYIFLYKDDKIPNDIDDIADISIVEEYDRFFLIETTDQNRLKLKERGYSVETLEDTDYVGLNSYSFNTDDGTPNIPERLKINRYEESQDGQYIVQFIGPIKNEWKEEIRDLGGSFQEYRHKFNFIVEMEPEVKREVEDLRFVNWVGIYQPAYRFNEELLERHDRVDVEISLFDGFSPGDLAERLPELRDDRFLFDESRIISDFEADKILRLARLNGVRSITERTEDYQFYNADATWITETDDQNHRKFTEEGITGTDQLVTVMDSKLYMQDGDVGEGVHEMWEDPDSEPVGDDHRKIQAWYVPGDSGGKLEYGVYHGTHVAGTVLGDSSAYGEYDHNDGNALGSRLIFQDIDDEAWGLNLPSDMYDMAWLDAYERGSRIHTNSWGGGEGYGGYGLEGDEFLWDHKDYNILFAMGNSGSDNNTLSQQSEGKNIISVGSVTNYPDHECVSSFSSRGYADDGRIKPTIMHVGEGVTSADESYDGYETLSGTSMSTPGIAGQIAQIRQYYEEGWHIDGMKNEKEGFDPSGALVRATLINGAEEITGSGAYLNDDGFPNNDQGYGRSNLDRVLHLEGDDRDIEVYDSYHIGSELDTGESWSTEFEVSDPDQELEVTLAWTDYPGTSGSDEDDPAIVNDLDLELIAPDGTRYVGNAFMGNDPGYSEPDPTENQWSGLRDGEYDGLNVEENVLLLPDHNGVLEGTYELNVKAHNVPEGTQSFAVVINGGIGDTDITEPPNIEVTSPVEGETITGGLGSEIEWETVEGDEPIKDVDLDYSKDGGLTWTTLSAGLEDSGSYDWDVPTGFYTDEAKIRATVNDVDGRSVSETSDPFEIIGGISTVDELDNIRDDLDGDYILLNDIDASATHDWEHDNGEGFVKIGTTIYPFTGTLDGNGYEISDLYINAYGISDNQGGLFGVTDGAEIKDLGIVDGYTDTQGGNVGGLVGYAVETTIDSSYYSGEVEGGDPNLGGLVGLSKNSVIENSYSTSLVDGDEIAGGLVGKVSGESVILDSYATGGINTNDWRSDGGALISEAATQTTIYVEYSYANSDNNPEFDLIDSISGDVVTTGSELKNTEQMTASEEGYPECYEGWNFDIIWESGVVSDHEANHGYPGLTEPDEIDENLLTINIEGQGTTDPKEGTHQYEDEKEVSIEASAEDDWYFVEWTGDYVGHEEQIELVMDEDKEITAHFEQDSYELDVTTEGEGTVDIEPDKTSYEPGEEVDLTAAADEDWYFVEWTGDYTGTEEQITLTMDEDKSVTASFEQHEYTLEVDVEGEGTVDIEPDKEEYEPGTEVDLTATADEHWYFVEWTGDYSGTEEEITVTMDGDKSVTAWFEQHEYTLEVDVEGEGTVDIEPDRTSYEPGTEVDLTAIADEDWYFVEWTGDYSGTEEQITLTIDEDKSLTAWFEQHEYTLEVSIEGEGTVDIEPDKTSYEPGEEVDLMAAADEDWYFDGWTGDHTGTEEQITLTMDEDKSVTAWFEQHEYTLEVSIEGEGTVDIEPDKEEYEPGTEVDLTATADEHWYFVEWTGDYTGTEEQITLTIDEDKSLTAWFEQHEYTLEVSIEGEGTVDIEPDKKEYEPGTEVDFTAVAEEHWYFVEWTGHYEGTDDEITVTMDGDKSVTAWFEQHEYTLEVEIEGEGTVDIEPDRTNYEPGEEVDLTAAADEHWYFDGWTGDHTVAEEQITLTIDEDKSLIAWFEQHEYTLEVSIEGEGIVNIEPDKTSYEPGEEVDLTATADEDWYFVEWTGDHEGFEESVTVIIDQNKELEARFEEVDDHVLKINVEGQGTIDPPTGTHTYEEGEEVDITAEPDIHWYFSHWSGDDIDDEDGKQITLTMDEDKSITAWFEQNEYTLEVDVEGEGTVDMEPDKTSYEPGEEVDLTATADEHWYFVEWTGVYSGAEEQITVTMDEDKSVTAWFEQHEYTLEVEIEGEGTVDIEPDRTNYEPGEEVDLTATADEHWYFDGWAGYHTGNEKQITLTMDEDKSVTACFEQHEYTLELEIEGKGVVDIEPEQESYRAGTEVTLTVDSAEDWFFDRWSGGLSSDDNELSLTMDRDIEIRAHFVERSFEVEFEVDGEGTLNIEPELEKYQTGTEIRIEAVPEEGWMFIEWSGDHQSENKESYITVKENMSVTAKLEKVAEPDFRVEILTCEKEHYTDSEVKVEYTVENIGEVRGTEKVSLSVDDEVISTSRYTLDQGERYSGEFVWEPEEEGTYEIEVSCEDNNEVEIVSIENLSSEEGNEGQRYNFAFMALLLGVVVVSISYHFKKKEK